MRPTAIALALAGLAFPAMAAAQVQDNPPAAPAPAAAAAPAPAAAAAPTPRSDADEKLADNVLSFRDLVPPAGRHGILTPGVTFDLETSEDGSTVSTQLSGGSIRQHGPNSRSFGSNWLVKVTVPIESLTALQKPDATLDLLSNGTKINFSYSFLRFRGAGEQLSGGEFLTEVWPAVVKECNRRARMEATPAAVAAAAAVCDGTYPDKYIAEGYFGQAAVNRSLYHGGMLQGGIEGAASVDKFDYIVPATLATLSPEKTSFSGSGFLSYYPSDGISMWSGRLEYQNGYKAGETQAICKPVVVNPAVDCVSGMPVPEHIERLNASVEYRRVIETGWDLGDFAVSPRVTYDTLSNEALVEFPVYFLPKKIDPKKGDTISPGFTATYSSKTEEMTVRFFLRTSFSFK